MTADLGTKGPRERKSIDSLVVPSEIQILRSALGQQFICVTNLPETIHRNVSWPSGAVEASARAVAFVGYLTFPTCDVRSLTIRATKGPTR